MERRTWAAGASLAGVIAGACAVALAARGCRPETIRRERVARVAERSRDALVVERRGMIVREIEPPFAPRQECRPGDRRPWPVPSARGAPPRFAECLELADGSHVWPTVNTPLVVAFDAAPVVFTRPAATTDFPIGEAARTEWVSAATPWLALDRDGSGCIESERELFAGFDALARLDTNEDGRIDARDPAFAELVLWADHDQDRRCTPGELTPLGFPIGLAHTFARDAWGSHEGETAVLPTRGGRVVDVYLAPAHDPDRSDFAGDGDARITTGAATARALQAYHRARESSHP